MLLLGMTNKTPQTVIADEIINLGGVYRKYCKKCNGVPAFSQNGTSVTLNQDGIYHITATLVGSGTVAGDVTTTLNFNGVPVSFATETITTATTEFRTFVIDYYAIVTDGCLLGVPTANTITATLTNTGVGATYTQVTFNVDKVV